jgi:hypothetical protein
VLQINKNALPDIRQGNAKVVVLVVRGDTRERSLVSNFIEVKSAAHHRRLAACRTGV